jgi:hypothetical protein
MSRHSLSGYFVRNLVVGKEGSQDRYFFLHYALARVLDQGPSILAFCRTSSSSLQRKLAASANVST